MCKWGISLDMPVYVWINHPEYPPKYELMNRPIDACLVPLIYKLNQNQVITLNSCCGHMQDKRFNMLYEDKPIHSGGSIIIDANCVRHADSLGYYVNFTSTFAEIQSEQWEMEHPFEMVKA